MRRRGKFSPVRKSGRCAGTFTLLSNLKVLKENVQAFTIIFNLKVLNVKCKIFYFSFQLKTIKSKCKSVYLKV